jgi:hypothetical protein
MRWASFTSVAVLVAVLQVGIGCGDSEPEFDTTTRPVEALELMVLGPSDVPGEYLAFQEGAGTHAEANSLYWKEGSKASYFAEFQVPIERTLDNGVVACITSELLWYDTSEDAMRGLRAVGQDFEKTRAEKQSLGSIGHEATLYHFKDASILACSDCCEDQSGESNVIVLRQENVFAAIETWAFGQGDTRDLVTELAQKQAARISSALAAQ